MTPLTPWKRHTRAGLMALDKKKAIEDRKCFEVCCFIFFAILFAGVLFVALTR